MNPLQKKILLKEKFNKRTKDASSQQKEFVSFKDLDLKFDHETYEWYRNMNGGAKFE